MIEWIWPMILFLIPAPAVIQRWWPPAQVQQAAIRAPFFEQWTSMATGSNRSAARKSGISLLLLWLIWLCALLAMARPMWIGDPIALPSEGRDLLVAVDISMSMQEDDMQVGRQLVERITVVKQIVGEFVEKRQGDRLGLILFADNAYIQAPLTFDTRTVNRFLQEARLGFAGETATAVGDAIGLAAKRLRDRPAQSRVLVLLTDGASNIGVDPLTAAKIAADIGIVIYTVGVGADEKIERGFLGSRRVNPSRGLDEAMLQNVAATTGGQYFRARNPEELAEIYRVIDAMEPVEQATATYRPTRALFYWPLALALALSLLLAMTRLGRPQLTSTQRGGM
ncbi:MAG: Ca-activated chloride channel family protein [Halieaceae bacterium]|jgi:Ca-activated chloride channel family protein